MKFDEFAKFDEFVVTLPVTSISNSIPGLYSTESHHLVSKKDKDNKNESLWLRTQEKDERERRQKWITQRIEKEKI